MAAWANLVGSIVLTMQEEDVGNHVIHSLLDHLDDANEQILAEETLAFALHMTELFRGMLASND